MYLLRFAWIYLDLHGFIWPCFALTKLCSVLLGFSLALKGFGLTLLGLGSALLSSGWIGMV
jgi:hypothetical protein